MLAFVGFGGVLIWCEGVALVLVGFCGGCGVGVVCAHCVRLVCGSFLCLAWRLIAHNCKGKRGANICALCGFAWRGVRLCMGVFFRVFVGRFFAFGGVLAFVLRLAFSCVGVLARLDQIRVGRGTR